MKIWSFGNCLKIEVLKIKFENLKIEFWKWFEIYEKDLKIGILKNYLKMEILKIKFENRNFGQLFENGSFKNWNFEELFENKSFEN